MLEKTIHERGSYLRDAVFAASDGVVTTFAIVAGSTGASLDPKVVVILGFANLFADGISMSLGTYLGVKSEEDFEFTKGDKHSREGTAIKQSTITFISFVAAGFFPVFPYLVPINHQFETSIIAVVAILFAVGTVRSVFTRKNAFKSGCEMLAVGGIAAGVAYIIGFVIDKLT
jgi:Uncharacterized membrane protein